MASPWLQRVETRPRAINILPAHQGSTIIPMLFAVLTVSDRCSQGLLKDTAGPAVVALLGRNWEGAEVRTGLVPDDEDMIAATLDRKSVV